MPRVIHFEIHAENPNRAIKFYETVFGWTFYQWPGPWEYWLATTGKKQERWVDRGPQDGGAGIGWLAYVKDTDGNILGVMQADSAAA